MKFFIAGLLVVAFAVIGWFGYLNWDMLQPALASRTASVSLNMGAWISGLFEVNIAEGSTPLSIAGDITVLVLTAVMCGLYLSLYLLPFKKESFTNDPNDPNESKRWIFFTEVQRGRAKAIMRGGKVVRILHGDGHFDIDMNMAVYIVLKLVTFPWTLFQIYCSFFGLHVLIPKIEKIYSYDLPRFEIEKEANGKWKYIPITGGPKFRTDHVRTGLYTWEFEVADIEVQNQPITAQGRAQVRIDRDKVREALFETDDWHRLLDQVIHGVTRDVMTSQTSIDEILGSVKQDIWEPDVVPVRPVNDINSGVIKIRNRVMDEIGIYRTSRNSTLESLGVIVESIAFVQFEFHYETEEDKRSMRAPILMRQKARGESLAGQGKAENQRKVLQVLDEHKDTAKMNVDAEALVKASEAGQLNALLATLINKWSK